MILKQTQGRITRQFCTTVMQTSDFISDRLYFRGEGYFSKPDNQLGYLKDPIPFTELFGYEDYVKILHDRYPKNAWLTPSEIFKPYYGMTIANYISNTFDSHQKSDPGLRSKPLQIIEAGAGNGRCSFGACAETGGDGRNPEG